MIVHRYFDNTISQPGCYPTGVGHSQGRRKTGAWNTHISCMCVCVCVVPLDTTHSLATVGPLGEGWVAARRGGEPGDKRTENVNGICCELNRSTEINKILHLLLLQHWKLLEGWGIAGWWRTEAPANGKMGN